MNLTQMEVSRVPKVTGLKGLEEIGRVCWASEGKITDASAPQFVRMLINKGHTSVLEHLWITLELDPHEAELVRAVNPKYLTITDAYVTANARAWREFVQKWPLESLGILPALKFHYQALFEDILIPESCIGKREAAVAQLVAHPEQIPFLLEDHVPMTFHFHCDRGITHELVRHRVFTFTQSSTRYIRYRNIDFSNEGLLKGAVQIAVWKLSLKCSELAYRALIKSGAAPQAARTVLPNATMATLYMTGSRRQWRQFLELREAPGAHPSARKLAASVRSQLV